MKTDQVFVSHTSDMAEFPAGRSFVQAALDAVGRAGMAPVDMRYFTAREDNSADYCQQRVRECEIFVAVIGFRYGSLVPGEKVSYTELEFDTASGAGLPRLVFLLAETAGLPDGLADADRGPVTGFRRKLGAAGRLVRSFTDAGSLELAVYQALTEQAGGRPPAARSLPRDIASFVGREPELRQLAGAARGGVWVIGGMAGIGKTAFAVHAAHQLARSFPGGQIFLPLAGHAPGQRPVHPADALVSLLRMAGVAAGQIPPGGQERTGLWRDRTAARRLLLVLDDAASSDQVRPLLPGSAGSLVLVTSRRQLTGLADARAISLETLPAREAAVLLVRLAGRPGLDPADPAVRLITELCGFLPLAVGMLASQLHHHPAWTAADLAAQLADAREARHSLRLLRAEDMSVAAAFDLSYADLSLAAQRLFRRLGLHLGADIDDRAAAALDGTTPAATRRHLEALYEHYLLAEPARGRYRLHDLIREHARSLAAADRAADRNAAFDRLSDFYQQAAASCEALLGRRRGHRHRPAPAARTSGPALVPDLPDRASALAWARTERANLLAYLDYATRTGADARILALTAGIAGLLRHDGPWADASTRHAAAAAAAQRLGDRAAEAAARTESGTMQRLAGDYQGAARALREAVGLYRDLRDLRGQASALIELGIAQWPAGDHQGAALALQEALGIYRDRGDRRGQANALLYLATVRYLMEDYPGAAQAQEEALGIYPEIRDRRGRANALTNLGALRRLTGDYQGAARVLAEALAICRHLGDLAGQASALLRLGDVRQQTQDYPGAAGALEEALGIYRDLGHQLGQANALAKLGDVRQRTGNHPGAAQARAEARGLYRNLGSGSVPSGAAAGGWNISDPG